MTTPFEEYKHRIQAGLIDLVTNAAGSDAFDQFHSQINAMRAAMSPSLRLFVKGATHRFADIHDGADELSMLEAEEMFWFGFWARGQFDEGNLTIPVHTDD